MVWQCGQRVLTKAVESVEPAMFVPAGFGVACEAGRLGAWFIGSDSACMRLGAGCRQLNKSVQLTTLGVLPIASSRLTLPSDYPGFT